MVIPLANRPISATSAKGGYQSVDREAGGSSGGDSVTVSESWESGIQWAGPRRCQTFWWPLTPIDHPERLWKLSRLESNPQLGPDGFFRTEIKCGRIMRTGWRFPAVFDARQLGTSQSMPLHEIVSRRNCSPLSPSTTSVMRPPENLCGCITCSGQWPSDSVIPATERAEVLRRAIELFSDSAEPNPDAALETNNPLHSQKS
jgi:hypothetical protein